jgi:hypothetical protein
MSDFHLQLKAQLTDAAARLYPASAVPGLPQRAGRRTAHPGWRRSRWPAAVLLAVAAAVVVLFTAGGVQRGSLTGPPPAAASVLNALARTAEQQPRTSAPGPGQYLYSATIEEAGGGVVFGTTKPDHALTACQILQPERRETWVAASGAGLTRETFSPAAYPGLANRHRCEAIGSPHPNPVGTRETLDGPRTYALSTVNFNDLPRDPAVLRAKLLTGKVEGGPPGPREAMTQVADLLRNTDASPAMRAELYRAAAGLPGVHYAGTVKDQIGRSGIGLTIADEGAGDGLTVLIFNPATSALIAEATIPTRHTNWRADGTVYLTSHIVNSLPANTPTPPTTPSETQICGPPWLNETPIAKSPLPPCPTTL